MFAASAAAFAVALSGQPAAAVEVARLPLGSEFGDLIAAPDGGAWVHVDRRTLSYTQGYGEPNDAIARASADHRFVQTSVGRSLSGGVLGFDGQAWFAVGDRLFRSNAAGTVTRTALGEPVGGSLTPGPDGTMWSPATIPQPVLQRIDAQGKVTSAPLRLPACERPAGFNEARTASDGAVWVLDLSCQRAIRIAPAETMSVTALDPSDQVTTVAVDRAGGLWYAYIGDATGVAHIGADGTVQRFALPEDRHVSGIAVAPDGAAYLGLGSCSLGRIGSDGAVSFSAAPIPATRLAFDPGGGLWLASTSRLVHTPAPPLGRGGCDDTPPRIRLSPALRDSVSLARLRRGIRIAVREPAVIYASGDYGDDDHDARFRIVRTKRGGTFLFRLPKAALRRLARARDPRIALTVQVWDREGNLAQAEPEDIRVTR